MRDIAACHKLMVGTQSAKKITDRLIDGIAKLADFPQMGVTPTSKLVAEAGYKMLIVAEYLCFYSIDGSTVRVHHVVHGSTDYIKATLR